MLSLPDHPVIDKQALVGGCTRLRLRIDAERLRREIEALPAEAWGDRGGGRIGVHKPAEAIFLRGHAPADGELPIEDRPVLEALPYARHVIEEMVPATPLRCLVARLAAGAVIHPHRDEPDYFAKTLRLHFPVVTDPSVAMVAQGLAYTMQAGEAWVLNNSNMHSVLNGWDRPRTHMICDFLPSPELCAMIRDGERNLGRHNAALLARIAASRPG